MNGSISSTGHTSVNDIRMLSPATVSHKKHKKESTLTFVCNIKAAKRIALLVGECIFCWLFYIVVVFINISDSGKGGNWNRILTKVGMMMNCSTLFLNPVVAGLLNPNVRKIVFGSLSSFARSLISTISSLTSYARRQVQGEDVK